MSYSPHNLGVMKIEENGQQTEISSQGEYQIVDSNLWEEVMTRNMSFDSNHLVVDNYGEFMVFCSLSVFTENSDVDLDFALSKNGDVVGHSSLETNFGKTENKNISLNGLDKFEVGDKISLKVRNNTDTSNLTVESAVLKAIRI